MSVVTGAVIDEARRRSNDISQLSRSRADLEGCNREGKMETDLSQIYRDYIACLNGQDWPKLAHFVDENAIYNGKRFGVSLYRDMLEKDFAAIPDLHFNIQLLICEPPHVASRLSFDCTPKGRFLGLNVDGQRISFKENVFYRFEKNKIVEVWSVIDKAAIEAQTRR